MRLLPAFRAGVDAWKSLEAEGGALDRSRLQALMLERFLSSDDVEFYVLQDDLAYLLERLDPRSDATAERGAEHRQSA
jgi:MoxR-like ATPase